MRAWDVLSRPCKSAKTRVGAKLSVCSVKSNACGMLLNPEAARSKEIPGACCSHTGLSRYVLDTRYSVF